jgi:hypothetical protein
MKTEKEIIAEINLQENYKIINELNFLSSEITQEQANRNSFMIDNYIKALKWVLGKVEEMD